MNSFTTQVRHWPTARDSFVRLGAILSVLIIAVFAGLLATFLPWFIIVPLGLLPLLIVAGLTYPEVGVTIIVAAVFGVIPEMILPSLSAGGGSIRAEDIGIAGLLLLLLVRRIGSIGEATAIVRPYMAPLAAFLLVALISVVYAKFYMRTSTHDILNEARPYYYWLMLPLLPLAVDTDARMRRFLRLLLGLALLLAVGVTLQSVAAIHIFQRGQLQGLETLQSTYANVVRSTTPGMFLMAAALIFLIASNTMSARTHLWASIPAGLMLLAGVVVGFGRGLWLSIVLGIMLLAIYARATRYLVFAFVMSIVLTLAVGGIMLAKPKYVDAAMERILSVGEEVQSGTSYGRRKIENQYAIGQIISRPLTGVGLGGQYKPPTDDSPGWQNEYRYIHNSYVNITTKLGIPGLLCGLWLVAVVLTRAFSAITHKNADSALAFTGFWTVMTIAVLTSLTQPNIISPNGVVSMAIAIFIVEWQRRQRPVQAAA